MNKKIEKAKNKIKNEPEEKQHNVHETAQKLIESKENSEIITKENLLTDITECKYALNQLSRKSSSKFTRKTKD